MLKQISKKSLFLNRGLKTFFKNAFYLSSQNDVQEQFQNLQDWQYVQTITKLMKKQQFNEALKYLIQSHSNNKILNKQIYYSFQQQMIEKDFPESYLEVIYKLYRQIFQPNSIMLDCMVKISQSENEQLINTLKSDFLKLSKQFPIKSKARQQSSDEFGQVYKKAKQQLIQEQAQQHGRRVRKVPTHSVTDQYYSNSPQQILASKKSHKKDHQDNQDSSKKSTKPAIQLQVAEKIQNLLQSMFNQYGKVTLHQVQLQLEQDDDELQGMTVQEMQNQMQDHYEDNEDDIYGYRSKDEKQNIRQTELHDNMMHLIASISKIKIGKVQLTSPKNNVYPIDIDPLNPNEDGSNSPK